MSEPLEALVERFLALREQGRAPTPQTFASDYPEHAAELTRLLELVVEMEGLTAKAAPPPLPELADSDFRLIRSIAAGGMGEVFEAEQVSLGRRVAVKVLSPTLLRSAEERRRFEHEARVIAQLRHPHIVQILSATCTPACCHYAMELVEQGPPPRSGDLRAIARLGHQAAEALSYAHRRGILHCDIKPANILIDRAGEAHLSDFGLAFALRESPHLPDRTLGTVRYMAPECLATGERTFATDQYALGVTLREWVTGAPVLPERDCAALKARILAGALPPLRCADADLAAIVNKAAAFRPEDRYPDMDALAEDLRRFLEYEPVAVRRSPLHAARLWVRRRPAQAAWVGVALLAVAVLMGLLIAGYKLLDRWERSRAPGQTAEQVLRERRPPRQGQAPQRRAARPRNNRQRTPEPPRMRDERRRGPDAPRPRRPPNRVVPPESADPRFPDPPQGAPVEPPF